ncbi:Uncharacterised protein [Kingella potus]|uniref:DUF7716 domain-containing protein n=1 Tax=Kingella potus TaxID=265175 RepID=A0A377R3R3_9NEIS|nr:hypothetical protein [Kingella potus]UOP01227.1 hypothetical protein LVJ84_02780 [Kingella potus]STR00951.1 Uncharacterised protein [Kingella potus]
MIKFIGIKNLIDSKENLSDYGFIYTLRNDDVETREGLLKCTFLLPENENDELLIESNKDYKNWLESPTFTDVVNNYMENHSDAATHSLINAVLHYWNHDDFLD